MLDSRFRGNDSMEARSPVPMAEGVKKNIKNLLTHVSFLVNCLFIWHNFGV